MGGEKREPPKLTPEMSGNTTVKENVVIKAID